jgi:hypothetical protein
MSRFLAGTLFLLAALTLQGCKDPSRRETVVGIYHANHGHGDETLTINADGSYHHKYIAPDGDKKRSSFSDEGTWSLISDSSGNQRLELKQFRFGYVDINRDQRPGWAAMIVEVSWTDQIRLVINDDLGLYFVKE